MLRQLLICILASFSGVAAAEAATISVANYNLLPNQPGQSISIEVAGGEPVSGLNLYVQVGDGGPELETLPNPLPAGTDGPAITGVDLKTGTIFAGVTDPQTDLFSIPQVAIWSIALTEGINTVPAEGALVTLAIDTTGFSQGTWDLLLSDVLPDLGPFDTDFVGTPAEQIVNGTISVSALLGDMDLDADVDFDDIDDFVLGLTDPAIYEAMYGVPPTQRGDIDRDGDLDFDDIPSFVAVFTSSLQRTSPQAVPEPSSGLLALVALLGMLIVERNSFRSSIETE